MRFHTAVLFFRDTAAARAWYETMGFKPLRDYEGMHWLALGEGELMLHPADKSSGHTNLCLHAGVQDVDAVFRRAVGAGYEPFDHQQPGEKLTGPVTRPWGSREFELLDPEGHRWAFTQDAQ